MRRNQLVSLAFSLSLGLMLWPGLGCAQSVGPELRVNQFFPIELSVGDRIVCRGTILDGPAVTEWMWDGHSLLLVGATGNVTVRPLSEYPHQEMTEQMIIDARARYTSVPFIDDYLSGNPDPTNQEWADAYEAWYAAREQFSNGLRQQFSNDQRAMSMVAPELVQQANQDELVVAGTAVATQDPSSGQVDLSMQLRGVPPHLDGTPEVFELLLERDWYMPVPTPTTISREDALELHHGINTLFESTDKPLLIDLSSGLIVRTDWEVGK